MDNIKPQGEFAQLNGSWVQIDTIDIVCGNISLHLLQLIAITVGLYAPVTQAFFSLLTLLLGQVSLSQLIDDLVLECGSTHSRLQNLQFKEFGSLTLVGTHIVEDRFERIFHSTTRQHLRRIVAGRLLTVASIQTIHKGTLGQDDRIACLLVAEHL